MAINGSKLTIALPQAAPITIQYEQESKLILYIMNGQYEDPSSSEDALADLSGNGSGPFVSLKTGEVYTTLPTTAVEMVDGALVTLTQGTDGL